MLVAKRALFGNRVPSVPGGGTVLFVMARAVGLEGNAVRTLVSKLLPVLLWTATLLLVYRILPAKRPGRAAALAGALLTALMLLVISLAAGFLYAHATKWSFIYGSLTSVFVFLYSVYLFASAVLFGAAFATEWSRPQPPDPEPLLTKARRRLRGLVHKDELRTLAPAGTDPDRDRDRGGDQRAERTKPVDPDGVRDMVDVGDEDDRDRNRS